MRQVEVVAVEVVAVEVVVSLDSGSRACVVAPKTLTSIRV
jgi:hypothetical protein